MHKLRRTTAFAAMGVALALVAAACGGSSKGGGGGGSNNQGQSSQIHQASTKKGGTLQIVYSSDCDYWDPARTYYVSCWNMQRWFERTLVAYAPKPGTDGATLIPDLATEVPKGEQNNTVWTYHLKKGLKYEDGTPITSKDIKYAVERVFAQDVINNGPTYVISLLQGGDKYKGPYKDKNGLASIETPDDNTITFKLNQPFSDWNFLMAMPTSTPVPQAKDKGANYTFHPVASGPYKIESYTPNKSISFVRNNQDSQDWRPALPDKIVVTMGLDPADEDNRIIANQDDLAAEQTGAQIAAQARILSDPSLKARSYNPVTGFLRYAAIFTKVPPFDNQHCRAAVAYAIDKSAQQLARGGPVGGGAIATAMLPPNIADHSSINPFPENTGTGNVQKAKSELAACGKPNGFSTKLVARNKGKEVKQAEAIQASLAKVGIKADIQKFDAATYYSAIVGIPANVHKNGYGIMVGGWGADWPGAYGFFDPIVDGRKIYPQGNSNYPEINDPTVNNAIDDAVRTTDKSKQDADWKKVDETVTASGAYIPLLYDKALLLFSNRLTNVYVTGAFGQIDMVSLGVTP